VSTYSGGIPEYVSHGQTGILVARGEAEELATAISLVLVNPALARVLGERPDNGRWNVSRGTRCRKAWLVCSRVCPWLYLRALQDLFAIISQERRAVRLH